MPHQSPPELALIGFAAFPSPSPAIPTRLIATWYQFRQLLLGGVTEEDAHRPVWLKGNRNYRSALLCLFMERLLFDNTSTRMS
jgi:hypothetical protein